MIMRELKFRAFNHELNDMSKQFSFGEILNFSDKHIKSITDETIMQYTGLKDKNGTDIYEGDIVNSNYFKNASVVFWRYGWHFNTGKDNHYSFNTASHSFEVIGNIHENPELLK